MINIVEDYVYHKFSGSKHIFMVLYVDDILFSTNDICLLHDTKRFRSKHFEMKDLSDAFFVLRILIYRDHSHVFLDYHEGTISIRYLGDLTYKNSNHMPSLSQKERSSVSINAQRLASKSKK